MRIGVIIGRFQVPELTRAHKELFRKVKAENNKVIVLIGQSDVKSTRRYSMHWRSISKMLREFDEDLIFTPIFDHSSNTHWSKTVDQEIEWMTSMFSAEKCEFTLYGGRDSFLPFYSGKYKTQEVLDIYNDGISGTGIRQSIGKPTTKEGRAGAIWATHNRYPTMFSVVDVIILDQDDRILLCRKEGVTRWGVIGGFVDVTDKTLVDAAKREAKEETGLSLLSMIYLFSLRIDERRFVKEVDSMMTHVFVSYVDSFLVNPVAADDIIEVKWFSLKDLPKMVKNHTMILQKQGLIPNDS